MVAEPSISILGYALLGLIRMQPCSGYELRKIFATTPMAHYSSSPGALYPALKRLEEQGLISSRDALGKTRRTKQVYSTTASGDRQLIQWLRQPVQKEDLQWQMDVVLLRFSYLDLLGDRAFSIEFLEAYARAARTCERETRDMQEALSRHQPLHGQLALENGCVSFAAQARWARRALATLRDDKKAGT